MPLLLAMVLQKGRGWWDRRVPVALLLHYGQQWRRRCRYGRIAIFLVSRVVRSSSAQAARWWDRWYGLCTNVQDRQYGHARHFAPPSCPLGMKILSYCRLEKEKGTRAVGPLQCCEASVLAHQYGHDSRTPGGCDTRSRVVRLA